MRCEWGEIPLVEQEGLQLVKDVGADAKYMLGLIFMGGIGAKL